MRYSPPIATEPVPGPSRILPTGDRSAETTRKVEERSSSKKDKTEEKSSFAKYADRLRSPLKNPNNQEEAEKREDPQEVAQERDIQPRAAKDPAQQKRIPVKDRWAYTSSSSDSNADGEESPVPSSYTNAGTSAIWFTKRQGKEKIIKRMPLLSVFKSN